MTIETIVQDFDSLDISTSTVVVYSNLRFIFENLFHQIACFKVKAPLTKKQKNIDKKKLSAPYGKIIACQYKMMIKGLNLRKKKTKWCTICRPYNIVDDKEVKHLTVTEHYQINEEDPSITDIIFYCSLCDEYYRPEKLKKINHFLNQLSISLSIGENILSIMMFKDKLKIAGCKTRDDAAEAVLVLWQDYVFTRSDTWRLKRGAKQPRFVFETVMTNMDFRFGFPINRDHLNDLMNREEYSNRICMSQYESTGQTNVNIKMYCKKPKNFKYDVLVFPVKGEPFMTQIDDIPYGKKKKEEKPVTFIVFSSSNVTMSGRYLDNMRDHYLFFLKIVNKNRKFIEEKPKNKDRTELYKQLRKILSAPTGSKRPSIFDICPELE